MLGALNTQELIRTGEAMPLKMNKLSPEEEEVIVHKGTEAPFSGEYERNFSPGTYTSAGDARRPSTDRMTNSTLDAGGPPSMTR